MAVTVFQDAFTEASNVNLASHTPNTGTSWTEIEDTATSTLRVEGGAGYMRATAGVANSRMLYQANPTIALTGADYDVQWTVQAYGISNDDPAGAFARLTDLSNYYFAGCKGNTGNYFIGKRTAATSSILVNTTASGVAAANDVLLFELRGTALRLLRNGAQILSTTDSDHASAGTFGFYMGNAVGVAGDDIVTNWQIADFETIDQTVAAGGQPTMRRWGGVPHLGGRRGFARHGGGWH